jgi:hypothetical protein
MGKSTISIGPFSIGFVCLPEGMWIELIEPSTIGIYPT